MLGHSLRNRLRLLTLLASFTIPLVATAQPSGPKLPFPQIPIPVAPPVQPHRPTPVYPATMFPAFIAIIVAAHLMKQKREQEEEEEVTPHLTDPTTSSEYKIIRSASSAFKHPDKFRTMLDEEARAGWELFEKLDCNRVRLRRSTACRAQDADLTQDAYRTRYGAGEGAMVAKVLLIVFGIMGVIIAAIAIIVNR